MTKYDRRTQGGSPIITSLVELAQRQALPAHQHMDKRTVQWIRSNRPTFGNGAEMEPPTPGADAIRTLIRAATVPAPWYYTEQTIDSLHGRRHCLRTAVHAAVLLATTNLPLRDHIALVIAAAVHDCRRYNDRSDRGHGKRAAEWLENHSREVTTHFGADLTAARLDLMEAAVGLHDVPYAEFSASQWCAYQRAQQYVDLLKAADALDRYRLPRLSWWPDPKLLKVEPPVTQWRFGFDLVCESEARYLAIKDGPASVFAALPKRWLP